MPIIRKGIPARIIKSIKSKLGLFKPAIILKILAAAALTTNIIPPIFSLNQAIMTPIANIIKNTWLPQGVKFQTNF